MKPFQTLTSVVIPLLKNDIDTDQIIPARYLKVTDKAGLAEGLFSGWRYLPSGAPDPTFPLNRPEYQGASILMAGDNFGCGSSREHAPWALAGWGIRAVISTSFADIFRNNSLKNGLLPVTVDPETYRQIVSRLSSGDVSLTVDLASQTLKLADGLTATFPIDPFSKTCLLNGVDSMGYLLNHLDQIIAFERTYQTA
ncbi:MAG TPA: 3-isopropylmalate dehydratase small subunit [Anaerolineales bacterium]